MTELLFFCKFWFSFYKIYLARTKAAAKATSVEGQTVKSEPSSSQPTSSSETQTNVASSALNVPKSKDFVTAEDIEQAIPKQFDLTAALKVPSCTQRLTIGIMVISTWKHLRPMKMEISKVSMNRF